MWPKVLVATKGLNAWLGSRHGRPPNPRNTTEADSSKRPSSRAEALGRIQGTDGTCRSFRLTAPRPGRTDGRGPVLKDTTAGVTTVVVTNKQYTLIYPCQAVSRASSANLGQPLKHVSEVRISLPLQRRNTKQNSLMLRC